MCTTVEKTWIVSVPEYKGSVLLFMCKIENSISQSQHARIFFSLCNSPNPNDLKFFGNKIINAQVYNDNMSIECISFK